MRRQDVEGDGELLVGRIQQDHVVEAVCRDRLGYRFDQVPVGIDHREAGTALHVLEDHVGHQRGFAHARRADHVHVAQPGVAGDDDVAGLAQVLVDSESCPEP